MESIVNWFQDWSDACRYAGECAPDLSFLPAEPYLALGSIGAACYLLWRWNERSGPASLPETAARAEPVAAYAELTAALDRARTLVSAPEKKAA